MKGVGLIPNQQEFESAVRRGEADPSDADKVVVFTYEQIRSILIMK